MRRHLCKWILPAMLAIPALAATPAEMKLIEAAKNQNMGALRTLLKQKVDVNAMDLEGMTPLLWAAYRNDLEAVKLLIAAGANVQLANRYEVTPLAEAAGNGNGEMIDLLLKAGADPNAAFGEGETPLMAASRTGSVSGVKALLAKGAKVDAVEEYRGQTALMFAVAENHGDVAKILIDAGANVNARSTFYDFKFRKVASGGTQANYSRGGLTPLIFAARQGALEATKVLVEAGADMNLADPEFNVTPLLSAIYNDHYDVAAYLVEKGASIKEGALYLAVEMRNLDYFGNHPRKALTSKMDELAFIKFLLDRGADPNAPLTAKLPPRQTQSPVLTGNGMTPFIRAARSADVTTMKLLLEHGADPKRASNDKTNAIIAAATGMGARFAGGEEKPEEESLEAIKLALEKGVDINAINDKGETAVHGAALRGANQIIQFLADHGAKLDVKNKAGRTPMDLALGVGGVANTGGATHEDTAALLKKLIEQRTAASK
jgi:ankyrin repeat protein